MTPAHRAELERLRSRLPFPMEAVTSAGGAWSIEPNVLWIGGCDPEESASLRDLVAAANAVPALLSALSAAESRAARDREALRRSLELIDDLLPYALQHWDWKYGDDWKVERDACAAALAATTKETP